MRIFKEISRLFASMSKSKKIVVICIAVIFCITVLQLLFPKLRIAINSDEGIFAEGFVGRIQNINPVYVDFNEADRDVSALIFSGLVRYDPLKKNFLPDLALSWERSKDGLVYDFTLRENALWHDEEPVTPDDILFTFNNVIQHASFSNPIIRNSFEGVTIASNGTSTVSFTLPKPNSYFISTLTTGILPKHLLETTNVAGLEKSPFGQHPIGSGPYMANNVQLDDSGDFVDLTVFPNYYGEKPKIQRLRIFTFPDEKSLIQNKLSLHAVSKARNYSETAKTMMTDPKFNIYNYTLNQFTALYFNTNNTFLSNKKARQALALALDKNQLLDAGEKRVDSINLTNNSSDPAFASDIKAANKILDDMGTTVGTDGIRINNKGDKLTFKLLTSSKTEDSLAEKIQKLWLAAGIRIEINKATPDDFYNFVSERRYDILLIKQNLGYNRDVYPLFHSSQANDQGLNFSNFKSFRTDGITEAIRKERDPKDKEKLLIELSKVIAEENPVVFISTPIYSYALDKGMQAFPTDNLDFHSDRLLVMPYLAFQSL